MSTTEQMEKASREYGVSVSAFGLTPEAEEALFDRVAEAAHALQEDVSCAASVVSRPAHGGVTADPMQIKIVALDAGGASWSIALGAWRVPVREHAGVPNLDKLALLHQVARASTYLALHPTAGDPR